MKSLVLILFLLAAAAAPAQTNQAWAALRSPVRIFGPKSAVDLTPLFVWWMLQPQFATNRTLAITNNTIASTNSDSTTDTNSDRPLTSWYRITGKRIGVIGGSWLVDAVVYTSPTVRSSDRIILNHPPAAEEQLYNNLRAQLAQATQLATNAQRLYQMNTNAAHRDEVEARSYRRSANKVAPTSAENYERRAAQKRREAAAALNDQKAAEAARDQILKQLKTIPSLNGEYRLDCFALSIGPSKQGQPIYDVGLVNPPP